MDRNERDRRQKTGRNPQSRSMGSRLGLQKGTPQPRPAQRPAPAPGPGGNAAPRPGTGGSRPRTAAPQDRPRQAATQLNPQKAGYQPGAPRQNRRVTQAEQLRRRNRRRMVGVGVVLCVMVLGILLSVNLLFKITGFRVENLDRTTPADTGIYSEEQVLAALGLQVGDRLFFSTAAKTKQLQSALPYLDEVKVALQMPGTVVVKVHPATERFAMMYAGGWMVLSDRLKILRVEVSQPEGLVLLSGSLPPAVSPVVGQSLNLQSYNSLLAAEPELATSETARATADETLDTILQAMQTEELLDGVSAIDVSDLSNLNFTYDFRVEVLLGGTANLDYKLRMAGAILLDGEKGLSASDHGTLDISQQQSDGDIRAYFQPNEPAATPAPEEAADEEETQEEPTQ